MSVLTDKLTEIANIKNQIKNILNSKSLLPVEGYQWASTFEQYPIAIERALENVVTISDGTKFAYSNWTSIPGFVTSYVRNGSKDVSNMFSNCGSLTSVGTNSEYYIIKTTNAAGLFSNCVNLISVYLEAQQTTPDSWAYAFSECASLRDVYLNNAGSASNYSGMFQGCTSLSNAPEIILSGNCSNMFTRCSGLRNIANIATSTRTQNITTASNMFSFSGLQEVPNLDLRSCQNAESMFDAGESGDDTYAKLVTVRELQTSSLADAQNMFRGQKNLETIEGIYVGALNVGGARGMFQGCDNLTTLNLNGLNNGAIKLSEWDFSGVGKWSANSLWNSLYTNSGRNSSRTNIKLSQYAYNQLSASNIETLKNERNIYVYV